MSDTETVPPSENTSEEESLQQQTKKFSNLTFSIWPPSQRTRDAVVTRLIETLSMPSVLSKRYGTIPHDEAAIETRRIEEEAFSIASGAVSSEEDGLEILQMYSKEISKKMLETVKERGERSNGTPSHAADVARNEDVKVEKSEEDSN